MIKLTVSAVISTAPIVVKSIHSQGSRTFVAMLKKIMLSRFLSTQNFSFQFLLLKTSISMSFILVSGIS